MYHVSKKKFEQITYSPFVSFTSLETHCFELISIFLFLHFSTGCLAACESTLVSNDA